MSFANYILLENGNYKLKDQGLILNLVAPIETHKDYKNLLEKFGDKLSEFGHVDGYLVKKPTFATPTDLFALVEEEPQEDLNQ